MFLKPSSSVIGPNDTIRLPVQSQQVEHEAELAIVIGGTGPVSRIDRKDAEKVIFGYTCANDVTARDLQKNDVQFTRAKGFDSFCPVGPWIETRLDVSDLEVRCEVGRPGDEVREVRQLGRTKDMIFDVPSLVSYVSHVMSLLPGDLILTGTPAGVSTITDGDLVSVRIEGIGELTNGRSPLTCTVAAARVSAEMPGGGPIWRATWGQVKFFPAPQAGRRWGMG